MEKDITDSKKNNGVNLYYDYEEMLYAYRNLFEKILFIIKYRGCPNSPGCESGIRQYPDICYRRDKEAIGKIIQEKIFKADLPYLEKILETLKYGADDYLYAIDEIEGDIKLLKQYNPDKPTEYLPGGC